MWASKEKTWSQAFLAETVETGHKYCDVTYNILFQRPWAFLEWVGPRILSLESVDYFRTSVTFHAKTYTNGFPLNGWSRWVPVGYPLKTFTKALEALRKPLAFFLYPLKALRKAVEKIVPKRCKRSKKPLGFFPYPLKALRKAVGKNVF